MSMNAGDQITYCLIPGMQRFSATVLSIDDAGIILRLNEDSPATLPQNQYIIIADKDVDIDYYGEVAGREGSTLRLKRIWTGKRDFFRVDDVIPCLYRKVSPDTRILESRVYIVSGNEVPNLEVPDETVSPRLWNLLVDMNTKLGIILERLHLESEGMASAEKSAVNISASGIRFPSNEKFDLGDMVEVKMLLPMSPAVGVLAHGQVVRVEKMDSGATEIGLRFVDLVEEVRESIIQYTLKRQRDIVRQYRERGI
jgi:hypothetical protein